MNGVPALKPVVGQVEPDSYAAAAGLRFGDRIVAIGDEDSLDWETALLLMIDSMVTDGQIPMRLETGSSSSRVAIIDVGDDSARLTEPGLLFEGLGFSPWQPPALLDQISPEGAADNAGLLAGDTITVIDGEQVLTYIDVYRLVGERPSKNVDIAFMRDGTEQTVNVDLGVAEDDPERGLLGVRLLRDFGDLRYDRRYGLLASVGEAVQQTWTTTKFTGTMLAKMATGGVSIRNISGPISIAQYAGDSASAGFDRFLHFLALISISLGVLNLLPIPILDGGQIVYQAIEGLKGSPLSEKFQVIGQQVGIFALLMLMSFAFYNDIARLFG